jgi:hypothetical protein
MAGRYSTCVLVVEPAATPAAMAGIGTPLPVAPAGGRGGYILVGGITFGGGGWNPPGPVDCS